MLSRFFFSWCKKRAIHTMAAVGFDSKKYYDLQVKSLEERMKKFQGRLYLEVGGHFFLDGHASRVLPGFDPMCKPRILSELKCKKEVILCVNAVDIEKGRVWASGETYEETLNKLIKKFEDCFNQKPRIAINLYTPNECDTCDTIKSHLVSDGYSVAVRRKIEGYPKLDMIFGEGRGYDLDDHMSFEKDIDLVVVIGLGSNCGKLSTCLGQVYLDRTRSGEDSGYAKFELFPIWNLPINHPTALAYEAATADIGDSVVPDHFHEEKYGIKATNYNRDVDAYPLLSEIIGRATAETNPMRKYCSPTDMGINQAGFAITDEGAVKAACVDEVKRRAERYKNEVGPVNPELSEKCIKKCQSLLEQLE